MHDIKMFARGLPSTSLKEQSVYEMIYYFVTLEFYIEFVTSLDLQSWAF